jgi:hypothetical protein
MRADPVMTGPHVLGSARRCPRQSTRLQLRMGTLPACALVAATHVACPAAPRRQRPRIRMLMRPGRRLGHEDGGEGAKGTLRLGRMRRSGVPAGRRRDQSFVLLVSDDCV